MLITCKQNKCEGNGSSRTTHKHQFTHFLGKEFMNPSAKSVFVQV